MTRVIRWFLIVVLALDAAAAAAFLTGNVTMAQAPPEEAEEEAPPPAFTTDALQRLGEELAARKAALDRREAEIEELLRSQEVLALAGIDQPGSAEAEKAGTASSQGDGQALSGMEGFLRLQRAYENMEPDSAARALAELAARDKDAVVELLLGWKPRTSGAILDSLTQTNPGLAADLSYEIWKRGDGLAAQAANAGR